MPSPEKNSKSTETIRCSKYQLVSDKKMIASLRASSTFIREAEILLFWKTCSGNKIIQTGIAPCPGKKQREQHNEVSHSKLYSVI